MIGKIVEIEERKGLFIVVDYKNNEYIGSCSYDREFRLYPYDSSLADDITVTITNTEAYKLKGIKNKIIIRRDKKAYKQYGYSVIRGVKSVMLERTWDDVVIPTR